MENLAKTAKSWGKIIGKTAIIGAGTYFGLKSRQQQNVPAEKRQGVVVVSNRLTSNVGIGKDGKIYEQPTLGGFGVGLSSTFTTDQKYEMSRFLALQDQYLRENGEVDTEKQELINDHIGKKNLRLVFSDSNDLSLFRRKIMDIQFPIMHENTKNIPERIISDAYKKVSEQLADETVNQVKKIEGEHGTQGETLIWVHDLGMIPVGADIKEKLPNHRVGYFHHIVFPLLNSEMLAEVSDHVEDLKELFSHFDKYDSIGVHSDKDKARLLNDLKILGLIENQSQYRKLEDKITVNPIGIPKKTIKANFNKELETFVSESSMQALQDELYISPTEVEPLAFPTSILHSMNQNRSEEWLRGKEKIGSDELNPKKFILSMILRMDPLKSIHEVLDEYKDGLRILSKEPDWKEPGQKSLLVVVGAFAYDNPAYNVFYETALEKMREIAKEFPGSIKYIPGIPREHVPAFHAMTNMSLALSKTEGYCISAGEYPVIRAAALEQENLIPEESRFSSIIWSSGLGISEEVIKAYGGKERLPEFISIVNPMEKGSISAAMVTHIKKWDQELKEGKVKDQKNGLEKLSENISDIKDYGPTALAELEKSRGLAAVIELGEKESKPSVIERSFENLTKPGVSPTFDSKEMQSKKKGSEQKKVEARKNSRSPRPRRVA